MFLRIIFSILLLLSLFSVKAQEKFALNGHVKDASTGEDLIGATIFVEGLSNTGTTTNSYGYYSISLPKGNYKIRFQFVGYQPQIIPLNLIENIKLDVELFEKSIELGNIVVTGERADKNITSIEMGNVKMTPKQIESIPVLFGERDILKIIQLTPGVKSAGEGNSGFYVRGGGIDQNLILLDEAPVYNASHLLGFFSVFNSEAIKNANLMKGSIPAEYGGRASSVFDINMKEGNMKKFGVAGNIGLISSSLAFEGPIVKDKGSFIVSGRRTYADMFLVFAKDEDIKKTILYFYDLNLKANYKINDNNRIYLSGYFGRDNFGFSDEFGFDWGSITGTLRWNHNFSNKLFSNTSLIFSNYSYDINIMAEADITVSSIIEDLNLKQDFTYYANAQNTIKFGGNIIHHNILPGKISVSEGSGFEPEDIPRRKAIEWAGYFSNTQSISERFKLYYGLRLALFTNIGPGEYYEFDENYELTETIEKEDFEFVNTQGGLEPRLALNYIINNRSSVKTSYNRIYQFLHLLSNSTTTTPTDLWLPSSNNVKPQISDQISMGYFRNFKENQYESSVEVYYKDLKNQIDYKNGAQLVYNSTVESELVYGKGWAYGAEFLLKRNYGRLNGWVSYTWSKTMRQFDKINKANPFPARQDRTHDISIVTMYDLTKKLKLSATWIYYTGNAVTFPSGKYEIDGQTVGYYTERNGYRMPNYHRLDFGLTWQRKKTEKFESSWNFSVYNAYARENAYFIDFRQNNENPEITEAVQFAIFKAIPSVSYKFKF
ncbi:MAG: carboxypeptidase-like regulatory domain-containing protein [Bacteroidetes bacterium]|nr:carboxypeptidase-like regulatory domain-containing protein [Bacteroidota bacterium]